MKLGVSMSMSIAGKEITVETGKLAKQADGSVVVRMGDTMLLATVVAAQKANAGVDFLPLTVDYREKYASAGRIPGNFFRREARPTDSEILTMRLVDRALRPLFPDDFHAEIQVMIQLMSYDGENQPDALCGLAASAAIAVSDIPFHGPISEVRVGRIDGQLVINPTTSQMAVSDIDMMIAGSEKDIVMLEGEMNEISEKEMTDAIRFAHEAIKEQCKFQKELASKVEKSLVKRTYSHEVNDEELEKKVNDFCYEKCCAVARQGLPDKHKRSELFGAIEEEFRSQYTEEELTPISSLIAKYFHDIMRKAVRDVMTHDEIRLDGRSFTQIRPIWCEVGYLPRVHGSAIFTRGETQSLSTLTLGGKTDEQMLDGVTFQGTEKFMLHYNFPPFSTGEVRPLRGISRREVGHGNLAYRALKRMIPEDFPYTVRLVSEILESNGSSSMATVCAGTLAMMDGGVPMKKPVSGIAMGLIHNDNKFVVLSDILGDEDHLGDMDFKVTGTKDGITACQMDIKVDGLPYEVLEKALNQAHEGRMHILGLITDTIAVPNAELKPTAPRIESFEVPGDVIGAIIGPGGKIIQEMQRNTNTTISIEEKEDGKGVVQILSSNGEDMKEAVRLVRLIAFPPQVEEGETYEGKVKGIKEFGCFVEIVPGTEGLIHISEYSWERVNKMEDVVKVGDLLKFKVIGKDPKNHKWKLSRKVLLPKPERVEKPTENSENK